MHGYSLQGKTSSKLEGSVPPRSHDPGSSKGTGETPWSSIDSHADMANFPPGIPPVEKHLPPPALHWKLSLEEIEQKHVLKHLDETKRYGICSEINPIPSLVTYQSQSPNTPNSPSFPLFYSITGAVLLY